MNSISLGDIETDTLHSHSEQENTTIRKRTIPGSFNFEGFPGIIHVNVAQAVDQRVRIDTNILRVPFHMQQIL